MADEKREPTQKAQGHEIPVPSRRAVERDLKKLIVPAKP
jgi:hypothetical protein